ncbi:MAG: transglutaminase family protein [Burkholderiaceae bacterium]|nr:transglutaminase family protein [Burkholderiaceae bacterium]
MLHVALSHVTRYSYDRRVGLSPHVVRLRPAPHCRTRVLSYSLDISPRQHFINWQQDPFSNYLARLVFPEPTGELLLKVDLVAEMSVYNPFDFFLEPAAENAPFRYEPQLAHDLAPYLACSEDGPLLRRFVADLDLRPQRTVDFLVQLNQQVQQRIRYLVRMEPGVQTPDRTLEVASGSCRDSGWLLAQVLRRLGLAARFVSGYLIQLKPDVPALDGPSGAANDFTDLHAWCEVYLPGAGWIGLDPTSGLLAGEGHLPLACTPEPGSAAPVTGSVDECEVHFEHQMSVRRLLESPRVTKPYTDDQWSAIYRLGHCVDADLERLDVRLTMGGEPTFVAVEARDADEWNTTALGAAKRQYAADLLHRLRERYCTGGFLHFGQGKWYPGEQLPRWALSAYWRSDGQHCWNDPSLFADERVPGGNGRADALRLITALARHLGLDPKFVVPGYEDAWYYLWRERRLPTNVDPFDSRLDDEMERARLRRVFSHGLAEPVGYALPVRRERDTATSRASWATGPWFLRDERMYLIPGDSPMGYRLPLDSLPWVAPSEFPHVYEVDPFAPRGALAPARLPHAALPPRLQNPPWPGASAPGAQERQSEPLRFESAAWITRAALCVEPRDGNLYVFAPPLGLVEDYLELLGAIEAAAADCGVRIVLEGYPPPRDPRLTHLSITPDPGVLEVNIHPAGNWRDLVDQTEFLYEAARLSRLAPEKFMLDGRHTGTGGGNHFVLGGPSPGDSPLLRRPDLLASLVGYWHNHPALSYLFSTLFIGPTSQAPRVDEGRGEQIYELEVALEQLRRRTPAGTEAAPWLVDRLFRNLLVDVTGNTHRAEFCIDKLYSPDGPTGRLGLLELRAFEMPPHARMSLVQQLMLRALVARFWQEPYRTRLTRWGTTLHDRFLLPTFVEMDLEDVLQELRDAGYPFDPTWFAPHLEFRFPRYGDVRARGIQLTLRGALEPWHVLGEQPGAGATARYVDSSVERVELHVSGLNDSRHVITVNGNAVPLQPTGRAGEFVAGVRYRAWQPPACLHPTIGVHAPLTFDIVDTWLQRSLAGCRYHVAHPGGRHYDVYPVNAFEAESRRLARFEATGHTFGKMQVSAPRRTLEYPFTLDLRRGADEPASAR